MEPTHSKATVHDVPVLSSSLIIYAYFLSSVFFAPIIPSVWLFIAYLVVVEILTYVGYRTLGLEWRFYDRLVVVSAAIAGYVLGMGIYSAALLLQQK
jgi:hypothetical protein